MDADYITRLEVERAFDRVEGRMSEKADAVLAAVRDLKLSMNGQFSAQGALIQRHERALGILEDRSGRDVTARVSAGAGGVIALIAWYFGIR
jgi:hypothetical protein